MTLHKGSCTFVTSIRDSDGPLPGTALVSPRSSKEGGKREVADPSPLTPALLPELPLEILERILLYTFRRRTETTPSSDPYPLRRTTHLLLVSRSFRELCLPIFFQSITIARPSDYITFFDPEDGLISGDEGEQRWSFVRELCIVSSIGPPSAVAYSENCLLRPLAIPWRSSSNELEVLCLLEPRSPTLPTRDEAEVRLLIADAHKTAVKLRSALEDEVGLDFQSSLEDTMGLQTASRFDPKVALGDHLDPAVNKRMDITVARWVDDQRMV